MMNFNVGSNGSAAISESLGSTEAASSAISGSAEAAMTTTEIANVGATVATETAVMTTSIWSTIASVGQGAATWAGASALNTAITVAASITLSISVLGVSLSGVEPIGLREGDLDDFCIHTTYTSWHTVDGNEMYFVAQINSILATAGASREEIAGVLGNFSKESGIDPTAIETVFASHNEVRRIGPIKQAIIDADFRESPHMPGYMAQFPMIYRLGIGLGQWTDTNDGGRRNTNLRNFADRAGRDWFTIDAQMAFMFDEDRANWTTHFIGSGMSLYDATRWFQWYWEGLQIDAQVNLRVEQGARLLLEIERMEVDTSFGQSILDLAGAAANEGSENVRSRARHSCGEGRTRFADNSSIAMAATSISWESRALSMNNNGTDLFGRVASAVNIRGHVGITPFPFASCDVVVAVAIRWAGADDNFPFAGTSTQYTYLLANPDRWEQIPWSPSDGADGLLPGDILINPGVHIVIYVGHEIASEVFPDIPEDHVMVSGSLDTAGRKSRSAGLGSLYPAFDGHHYYVFRNISPEVDSQFINVNLGSAHND